MSPTAHDGSSAGFAWKRRIGIVGGLGPYAHVEFERLLLRAAERLVGRPPRDQDYPGWLLVSVPETPDRTSAIRGDGASPLADLERAVRWLRGTPRQPGADFAVIPCNAAHAWLDELRARCGLPLLDMISEALRAAVERVGDGARIGLLATTGTLRAGIYERAAAALGSRPVLISTVDLEGGGQIQEDLVMTPIYGALCNGRREAGGIKSGNLEGADAPLRRAVTLLADAGADLVIAACTEIPLVLGRGRVHGVPLLDPMEVAAEVSVAIAAGSRALPA